MAVDLDKQIRIGEILSGLALRDERSASVLQEIGPMRAKLDMIESVARSEQDIALRFAGLVLQHASGSQNDTARDFAKDLVVHLHGQKPVSSFLNGHPQYKDLDLTWLIKENPEVAGILEPIKHMSLADLLSATIDPVLDGVVSGNGKSPKQIESVKKNGAKSSEAESEFKEISTIDELSDMYPIVADLLSRSDCWQVENSVDYLSRADLDAVFGQREKSGNKDQVARALYQGIRSLLIEFQGEANIGKKDILGRGRNGNLYSRSYVERFLVFAANKLGGNRRTNLMIKNEASFTPVTQGDSKKK